MLNTVVFQPLIIQGESLDRVGLSDCEICKSKPCKNGGSCREISGQRGFVCDCRPGYSGITCGVTGQRCYPGACVTGRCINTRDSGFKCLCPVGFSGNRCQQGKGLFLLFVYHKKVPVI